MRLTFPGGGSRNILMHNVRDTGFIQNKRNLAQLVSSPDAGELHDIYDSGNELSDHIYDSKQMNTRVCH